MSGKEVTCKTPVDFRITTLSPDSYQDIDGQMARDMWGKNTVRELKKRRKAYVEHCAALARLPIGDSEMQQNLMEQVISALQTYPEDRRRVGVPFTSFVYLVEPRGAGFYVADMEGAWDENGAAFTLKSIVIQDLQSSINGIEKTMSDIQSLNPGVPKLGSGWFNLIEARRERVELV